MSQEPALVRVGGEWLAAAMRARGLEARVLETGGNPAVFGERRVPGARRTILFYCHYDTKPIPPAGWLQPSPIEPVLRRGLAEAGVPAQPFEAVPAADLAAHRLYARGASDDKGPIWCHLEALRLMDRVGIASAVNVKLIFDGEEEIGSPFFGPFTEKHRDMLAADLVLVTDGPKHDSGRPTVAGGARGNMKIEMVLEAARRDLHSGNFVVPNPAWKLNGLLSSMATPDGVPLIEGLEEDVVMPTAAERKLMADIPMDLGALGRELGVPLPADYLERMMFHTTLNIRGLQSGLHRQGRQHDHPPPRHGGARHPPGEEPAHGDGVPAASSTTSGRQGFHVIESADAPLPDDLRGKAIRVVEKGGYDPAKSPVDTPLARHLIEAIERAHGGEKAVVMPTLGGSVPLWAFTDILQLPTYVVPYASAGNRQHSPNEHLKLDHLFQGVRTTAGLLQDLAAMPPA